MNNIKNEIITILSQHEDDLLKDWLPTSCCNSKTTTMKHVYKSPEAKRISDLLKQLNRGVSNE